MKRRLAGLCAAVHMGAVVRRSPVAVPRAMMVLSRWEAILVSVLGGSTVNVVLERRAGRLVVHQPVRVRGVHVLSRKRRKREKKTDPQ